MQQQTRNQDPPPGWSIDVQAIQNNQLPQQRIFTYQDREDEIEDFVLDIEKQMKEKDEHFNSNGIDLAKEGVKRVDVQIRMMQEYYQQEYNLLRNELIRLQQINNNIQQRLNTQHKTTTEETPTKKQESKLDTLLSSKEIIQEIQSKQEQMEKKYNIRNLEDRRLKLSSVCDKPREQLLRCLNSESDSSRCSEWVSALHTCINSRVSSTQLAATNPSSSSTSNSSLLD